MRRYLVTGCAGFIASGVCGQLLHDGAEVVGVDNINDAYDRRLKRWRLARLTESASFHFHDVDVSDAAAVASLFDAIGRRAPPADDGSPLSAVLHLAARAGVRPSVENPWMYVDANITGTLNVLDCCRRGGIKKLVLASTSSLYGQHNPIPYREDADTSRPLSPYAASKGAAESMAYTYHHLHGLDVTVLRYFTVYGPAGRPDMSVFRFIRRIAEGEPIVVFGDGTQQRDFTYVDDIVRGTVAAARPLGFEVINLGGDRPVPLADVIEKIGNMLNREVHIERRPSHPADVPATWADISKAASLLDWKPQVSIDEGLSRTAAWYLANREEMRQIELGD
jgi:nucleoside-diphosphate-sugar epimerase